ncbi:MAG TPA: PQQ-binding-like beta-propeller repeat protein [Gemmata sp.]|jgi:outer membrane protein assembly factor BamB|nr:PQQ-binding-like beta-propeller repeat protein [Gemmata sp.]
MKLVYSVIATFFLAVTALNAHAGDWPTILGPSRNGVSTEKGIIAPWPKTGLKKLWECDLGIGFAPPVVAGGRLFHFDRFQDTARLTCRDAVTGKEQWKFEYPTAYEDRYGYDPGPRACPVVDQDRVYLYGAEGMLYCLKTDNGKELWHVDTQEKYNFKQNFFGVGSVPVVDDGLLIVAVGGSAKGPRPADFRDVKPNGTGLVAFNKLTGEVKYVTGDELASYSSPIVTNLNGKKMALYFSRAALVGFDPQTGETAFRHPWRARDLESVNASNPVVIGDKVLLSECYGPGSVLLDLKSGKPKEVWSDAGKDRLDKSLLCHWNTPIHVNGFIYGCSGRHDNDAELRCIELATGDVKWAKRKTFRCTLLLVDGYFVCLSEYGQLSLLKINPEKYDEVSSYEVPELDYPCWAPPVLSNGILYLRGKRKLVALELIPSRKP